VAIRRGAFCGFKSAFWRLCFVPHNGQHKVERHLATGLCSFDISEAALIASASRAAKWIARLASSKRAASLFSRIVYSVEHNSSLSRLILHAAVTGLFIDGVSLGLIAIPGYIAGTASASGAYVAAA
jgi:hypothetical protein